MDRECKRGAGNRHTLFFVQHAMSNSSAPPSRTRNVAAIVPTLALAALIAGCNVGQAQTPVPTAPPTSGPSTGPTAEPTAAPATPSPTPTPVPTTNPDQIEHPTGAEEIILRMEEGGGFVPFGFMVTQAPTFTLYGDGTVIFKPVDNRPNFEAAYLPWQVAHLDETGIQALLEYALTTGRLANARESYDNPMVADAGSTMFTLDAAGQQKVVNVYALFEIPDPGPDAADRSGFNQLR